MPRDLINQPSDPAAQFRSDDIPRQNLDISRLALVSRPDRLEKPAKLRADLLCLAEAGGDPHAVLQGSGITLAEILAQTPVPCSIMADLFDRLAKKAPSGFGISCGRFIRLQYLGMLGYRLSNCSTIGELLNDWARYSVIIGYPLGSAITIDAMRWTMTFRPRYPLSRDALTFCVESTLSGFTQSLFNMTGCRLVLQEAGFPFSQPDDHALYNGIDAEHVSFDWPAGFVAGRTEDLAIPLATADPEAREVCDAHCRESLSGLSDNDAFADRVKATIGTLGAPFPEETRVSQVMGVSTRTLQRNLAAEGQSFHRVVDDMRRDHAIMLIDQGFANKRVAHDLGYGDVASFHRAFKRWTGEQPSAWRARGQECVNLRRSSQ